jgi:hypothetical protein
MPKSWGRAVTNTDAAAGNPLTDRSAAAEAVGPVRAASLVCDARRVMVIVSAPFAHGIR